MSANPWMPWYVADYIGDTMHLSTLEHGAYCLLIMAYWQRQEPLPADPVKLAQICRMTPKAWEAVAPTISEFFEIRDGVWMHHRIEREISTARTKYERRASAGRKGGLAKAASPAAASVQQRSSIATAMPEQFENIVVAGLYQPQPQQQSSLRSDVADDDDVHARPLAVVDGFKRPEHVDIAVWIGDRVKERFPGWLPPGDGGRIKSWLSGGWTRETIEDVVQSTINRMATPPRSFKFFENSIADVVASMSAPLPTRGTDRVSTPSARDAGPSNLTAQLARLAAQRGG